MFTPAVVILLETELGALDKVCPLLQVNLTKWAKTDVVSPTLTLRFINFNLLPYPYTQTKKSKTLTREMALSFMKDFPDTPDSLIHKAYMAVGLALAGRGKEVLALRFEDIKRLVNQDDDVAYRVSIYL